MKYCKAPTSSFLFLPLTSDEVKFQILSIPNNKSYGLYSSPIKLLKCARSIIAHVLSGILNISVTLGKYPSKLKLSKIPPIFKSGEDNDANNYRPVSLLSNFNRIFEKIMYNRVKDYIDRQNLLYSSQYGFRKGHSTQQAILDIVNAIQTNMNQGLFSCVIDLKKAFDTVDHKLNHYGFRGIIKDWFSSYLNNRMQSTQIGPYISNEANVSCGIPQGAVLGPLLFYCMLMTYINARINLSFISSQMILISFMLIKT